MQLPYSNSNAGLHYDLRIDIDPRSGLVSVSGSVAYRSPKARLERARFYLHRQFLIHRLEGRRVLGYHFEAADTGGPPSLPLAIPLDVYFDPPLNANETTLIQFEYRGLINEWQADSPNVITPEWAELGLYLPWFPMQYDGKPSECTYTLKVTCPPKYGAAGYGKPTAQETYLYFECSQPTTDIVVAVGQTLQTRMFESDANRVYLSTSRFSDSAAARLGEDMLWVLERFSGWFGPIRPADFTLIESPRALGGGYARSGLVVLAGLHERDYLDQPAAHMRNLAREAAHAWWQQAPTGSWEEWLNESFAEYSALLAVRERFGEDTFDLFMNRKSERAEGAPALWNFPRSTDGSPQSAALAERMLYDRGPLVLHDLANRLDSGRFLELCRAMLWSGVADTEHLLDLLQELEGTEARGWLQTALKDGSSAAGTDANVS